MTTALDDRFWSKVDRSGGDDDCWIWKACRAYGYGKYSLHGKDRRAHRLTYEAFIGAIPVGLQIDHLCRNKACVNPSHLEAVTGRENTLRGIGPTARNALKTICIHGHELNHENVYLLGGRRKCRACHRLNVARYRAEGRTHGRR